MWVVWVVFAVLVCAIGVCWGLGMSPASDTWEEDEDCESWFGGKDDGNL